MLIIQAIPADTGLLCNVTIRDILKCFHLNIPCYLIFSFTVDGQTDSMFERLTSVTTIPAGEESPAGAYRLRFTGGNMTVSADDIDGYLISRIS